MHPADSQLGDLVRLAARICGAPSAAISVIDRNGHWLKARHGLMLADAPRTIELCECTLEQPEELFTVSDTRADPRFVASPRIAERPALCFFAGVPLRTQSGRALGTFCILDDQPRELTDDQRDALNVLARQAVEHFELRLTRIALAESEERCRILLNRNPLPLFVFDRETLRYLTVNDAAVAHYGYTRDEFHRMTVVDLRPAEDRPRLIREIEHGARGLAAIGRWRHLLKNGTLIHVDVYAHDLVYGGRAARIVLAVDVSEQLRAHDDLKASEARFRALSDSAPIGIFESNIEGRCTYCNAALLETTGWSANQALRFGWTKILHPEDRAMVRHGWKRAAATGQRWRGDIRLVQPDGTIRWTHALAAPNKDAQGRVVGFVGTIEDVTEKRLADLALLESEERFKVVARAVSDVIWDMDLKTRRIWWSDGVHAAFGYMPDEIGHEEAWAQRIHPEERERVLDGLQAVLTEGDAWEAEYRFRRKDGTYAQVFDRAQVMRDAHGLAVRLIGGLSDQTERKTLEAQFLRAQRMESIGTLAGGIAHDLNNVLTPILLSLEILRLDLAEGSQQAALLNTLESSAHRGASLVRQVLTFARGVEGQRVSVNVRQVLEELERIVRETFPRNLEIAVSVPPSLWRITGDATQVHQVLLNLAVNARDAMPEGGALTVTAENIVLGRAPAGPGFARQPGPYVRITIVDTGTGIPPDVRERMFEPFFTTKAPGKGTGLGLATVHAVVKSHHGFVDVQSEPGAGTTFTVHLPADADAGTGTRAPFPGTLPPGRGEQVLVVDDEESIRVVAERILRTHNYRVLLAANGAEAWTIFQRHQRDIALVITDMMMPVLDGAGLIQAVRRRDATVRIIAMSGLHVREHVARVVSHGTPHFLAKPFSAEKLLHLARQVLDAVPHAL